MPTPKLDPRPARNDLTSRECCKIISGLIGVLSDQATLDDIRTAVRWCAENDVFWEQLFTAKVSFKIPPGID